MAFRREKKRIGDMLINENVITIDMNMYRPSIYSYRQTKQLEGLQ